VDGGQPGARLEVRRLDLADLDSVKAFAAGVHDSGLAVDVLVNNAGVMAPPRTLISEELTGVSYATATPA
jgi:NAD(P)-dependent dehydrogenase (short-subunit alcohol dehydrogenase family)